MTTEKNHDYDPTVFGQNLKASVLTFVEKITLRHQNII